MAMQSTERTCMLLQWLRMRPWGIVRYARMANGKAREIRPGQTGGAERARRQLHIEAGDRKRCDALTPPQRLQPEAADQQVQHVDEIAHAVLPRGPYAMSASDDSLL
jgi:hypothetical protein